MIGEHDVRHPLCENVDFQHLATGELIKRMLSDAPIQNDSDNESLYSEMENIPSPDSAVILPTWSRESTPLEAIANSPETFTESEVPERSPDSGIMSEKISQSTDDVLSPSTHTETNDVDSPPQTEKTRPENRPMGRKSDIISEKGEDFDVGQVVWVWLASYPLWPGMIAPAPEQDPDHGKHFKQNAANQKRPTQFHCQFFGPTEERSWVSSKAIIPWDDDVEPKEQFNYISNSLKSKLKGKLQKRIVTQIKSDKMKNSWNQAVLDALSARNDFENDEQRCDKLLYDYTDKPKPKPTETTKRKSTAKRKSLIPNSIKYKITPFSELNYRESQSTTFDPDLHIPNELFENQKFKNVPLELVRTRILRI